MRDYLLYNGSFYTGDKHLVSGNSRGLRFGDGLFETLRMKEDIIQFKDWHFERLFDGLQRLLFELPGYFTPTYLADQVLLLCKKNGHRQARVRLTIIRGNGGLYDPENHFPNLIIQSWPLPSESFRLNENGLVTGIYPDARKTQDSFANLKSNNFLPYSMAALYAKQQQWNDALLLNSSGMLCDTSMANIFIVKNSLITTCPLTDGCIAGIIRRYLVHALPHNGFGFQEKSISIDDLQTADEVFLTNTIRGLRWVSSCAGTTFNNRIGTAVYHDLLKKMI